MKLYYVNSFLWDIYKKNIYCIKWVKNSYSCLLNFIINNDCDLFDKFIFVL